MKKRYFIPLITLCVLPHLVIASEIEISWKVWKKNSQLSVSYRPASAFNKKLSSELIEIKATAKVNSTLAGFLLFIQQVDNTQNWLVNASTSQIIKQISLNENIFFIKFLGLWPLKPRLLVLHSTYWQNDDLSVEITLSDEMSITDTRLIKLLAEEKKTFLRIKTHYAHWKITPQKIKSIREKQDNPSRQLFIEYRFIADGVGDSPKWLADHLALKSIWKSMRNIKRQLPKDKWQAYSIDGITELNH